MVTVKKFPKVRMTHVGETDGNGNFDWVNALIDSGIAGAFTFVSSLAGMAIADIFSDPESCVFAAGIAALVSFFGYLAAKRGIIKND